VNWQGKLVIGIVALILVGLLVVLLLSDFVRETVAIPIWYLVWLGGLVIRSLPQQLLWGVFVVVSFLIVFVSLSQVSDSEQDQEEASSHTGPVLDQLSTLRRLGKGVYFRWRLAHDLRQRVIDILAYTERISPEEMEERLMDGGYEVPDVVEQLLIAGLPSGLPGPISLTDRLFRPGRATAHLNVDFDAVIRFLETKLEIGNERRNT